LVNAKNSASRTTMTVIARRMIGSI
jgi:hypothetical protein